MPYINPTVVPLGNLTEAPILNKHAIGMSWPIQQGDLNSRSGCCKGKWVRTYASTIHLQFEFHKGHHDDQKQPLKQPSGTPLLSSMNRPWPFPPQLSGMKICPPHNFGTMDDTEWTRLMLDFH